MDHKMKHYLPFCLFTLLTGAGWAAPQPQIPALSRWMDPSGLPRPRQDVPQQSGPLRLATTPPGAGTQAPLADQTNRLCLVIASNLWDRIQAELAVWENDLRADGFTPVVYRYDAGTAPELRAYLAARYGESASLDGAMLIGDIPHIVFEQS